MRSTVMIQGCLVLAAATTLCSAFTKDTTGSDTTGPLVIKKDTVYEIGFVVTFRNDSVKIKNSSCEPITIDHILVTLHGAARRSYEVVFWTRLLGDKQTQPIVLTDDKNPYELGSIEKIKIPGNKTCVLNDFNLDCRPSPESGIVYKGDTLVATLVLVAGQSADSLVLIGVQTMIGNADDPDNFIRQPEAGELRREFSKVRPGGELEKY